MPYYTISTTSDAQPHRRQYLLKRQNHLGPCFGSVETPDDWHQVRLWSAISFAHLWLYERNLHRAHRDGKFRIEGADHSFDIEKIDPPPPGLSRAQRLLRRDRFVSAT